MSDKYPGGFVTANAPAGFSVAFDGTGDYFTAADNANLELGSGDFTIEGWINTTVSNGGYVTAVSKWGSSNQSYMVRAASTDIGAGWSFFYSTNGSNYFTVFGSSINDGAWHHIAVTRSGNVFRTFTDGVLKNSTTDAVTLYNGTSAVTIGAGDAGANPFTGYLSNVRIVKGTALYTAAFTLPTQLFPVTNTQLLVCQSPTIIDNSSNAFTLTVAGNTAVSNFTPFAAYQGFNPALGAAAGGVWTIDEAAYYQNNRQWPIYDPYFKQTTLMLHGNGTNAAQNNTFLDSSTNNFTITRNGNTTQGSFSPFSQTGWSNYFDGGSYLSIANNANLNLGSSNFTIEFWVYAPSSTNPNGLISKGNTSSLGSDAWSVEWTNTTGTLGFGTGAFNGWASPIVTGTVTLNSWNHVAVVRNGTTHTLYINGTSASTATASYTVTSAGSLYIGTGWYAPSSRYFVGYISNTRLVIGTAVYTSNFTPPTAPLTAVTGTQLLTCQDNRFVDDSANNFAITATGSPSVQAFSPFVPAYITPTTYSNYFDGTGDYLSSSSANYTATGDFTAEAWFYATSNPSFGGIINTRPQSNTTGWAIGLDSTQKIRFFINGTDFPAGYVAYNLNQWYHVALVRSGSTVTGYINGISAGTTTNSSTTSTTDLVIGRFYADLDNYYLNGVVSNARFVNGTAIYTANFTPPNAPFPTGTTNQQLLTCQASTMIDSNTYTTAKTITANGNVRPVTSPTPFPANVDTTTLNSAYSTSLIGGSGYFSSSSDYLTTTGTALGSGAFTIELWIYPTSVPNAQNAIYSNGTTDASSTCVLSILSGRTLSFYSNGVSGTSTATVPLNAWSHVAAVRSGTTVTIYLNGVSVATVTISNNISSTAVQVGRGFGGILNTFIGYYSGLRTLVGTALYTQSFAPPVAPLTNVTNTSLLLNYTNGAIFDNTAKNVLETVGNAQISTTQSKWGGSSMAFDGNGDYLSISNTPLLQLGSSDWTIECWAYINSTTGDQRPISQNNSNYEFAFFMSSGGAMSAASYQSGGSTNFNISMGTLSAGQWYHLAASRSGSTVRAFVNGVLQNSATYSGTIDARTGGWRLGASYVPGDYFNGYLNDVRITKYARYITNFTPPTSQLQDQ